MRAVRILLRCLVVLAAIGVLAAGAVAWLLGTEAGTRWLLARALERAEPYVTAGAASGTLLGTLVVRDLRLSLPGHEITIPRVSVTPELAPLLGGTLHVRALDAAVIEHRQVPAAAETAAGGGAVELPVDIVVERIAIAGVAADLGDRVLEIGPTEAAVAYRGSRLEVERLSTSAAGFELAGRAAGTLAEPLAIDVALDWSGSYEGRRLAGRLIASGPLSAIEIRHELTAPFTAVTDGRVELDAALGFDLDTDWRDAGLEELAPVRTSSGTLRVSGSLEQFELEGEGVVTVEGPDGAPREAAFAVTGARDGDTLRVMPLSLRAALGRVEARGRFDLAALAFEVDVDAESLNPASELPDWPADLDAAGRLSGRLDPELEVAFDDFTLEGSLRGRPLMASGALDYSASAGLRLRDVAVESGPSRATLNGRLAERIDARLTASIEDLADWLPELEGALEADLALGGSVERPRVSGRVVATELAYDDVAAERISFEGDVGTELDSPVEAVIEARGLRRGALQTDSITAELAGDARDHTITLDVAAPGWRAAGAAAGSIEGRTWQGSVAALDIVQDALGEWRLAEPVALELGPGNWRVATACLRREATSVCGSLTLTGAPEDALTLRATDFDLRALAPLLPPDLELAGTYQLDARIMNLSRAPSGEISIDGAPTTVGIALSQTQSAETVIDSVDVDVVLDAWAMRIDAGFSGRQTGEATLNVAVDDIRAQASPVDGRISVRWEDLAPLSLLTPDVGQVGGSVGVDLTLGGTLDEPTVEGVAELTGGSVSVPAWGTDFEAIEARATSRDGRTLDLTASGRAGDGTLNLEGTTTLDPGAGWPTRALVRGEAVRAVQLPEAEVLVSPNLNLLVTGTSVQVAGIVHVPSADIRIEQLPQQAVTPSADAVIHGRQQIEASEPRRLDLMADMTLTLGDDVSYSGAGLTADLSGDLRLQYRSGEPESATGTLNIDGTYTAYGQTLELERSRLLFTGPIDNPTLDVRAVRRIDDITVGVQLAGRLQSPQTSIFSTPTMSEADALSYLLFGRPLENAGESADGEALEAAALSMGLQQALPVVERIGESLGLDELTVRATEVDSGALMAGKQLSPKLYIRYSYGLFNRIGGLLLRFKVNERLSIETRSGDQKSMDLLYTVEKD